MSIFKKRWVNSVLLENEKEAVLIARGEGLPDVNPDMGDIYPVDVVLPKKRSFREALRKVSEFSRMGLYSMIIKKED